jgi:hypothetical protein
MSMKRSEIYYLVARLLEEAEQMQDGQDSTALDGEFTELPAPQAGSIDSRTTAPLPELHDTDEPDDQEPPPPAPDYTTVPLRAEKRIPRALLYAVLCAALLLSFLIGAAGYYLLMPSHARAIVTLYMDSRSSTRSATLTGIATRTLEAEATRSKTVPATGTVTRSATTATGRITFYNASFNPQVIPAGTALPTGNGSAVITDASITIQGAHPPTEGSASVRAHSAELGAAGNLSAYAVSGACCNSPTLFAYSGVFAGGAEAQHYQTPTAQDMQGAAAALKNQIDSTTRAQAAAQLQPGQTVLWQQCTTSRSADAQPGAQTDHVTVTLDERCMVKTAATATIDAASSAIITQAAAYLLGSGYTLFNTPQTHINGISTAGDTARLAVTITAAFTVQLSAADQQRLKTALAGQPRERAAATLLTTKGVTRAQIDPKTTMLPDASRIDLQFVYA